MKNLFFEGGPLFMGILTVILIIMVAWSLYHLLPVLLKKEVDLSKAKEKLKHIKTFGTFSLVFGILGQLIGLMSAFDALEKAKDISFPLMMGGLKISLITTIYGILIFLTSLLLWFVFDYIATKKSD